MHRSKKQNVMLALAPLLMILLLDVSAYCQNSVDDLVKECEACADERKVLRIENAGLKDQLRMKDEMLALQAKSLAEKTEIINYWKEAATARKEAITIDDRLTVIRETQLTECRQELARERHPSFFNRLFKPDTLTAGVIGFGIGNFRR